MERKYGDVAALNEAWWNVFWSMEYRSFSEVDLPNLTVTEANPSHKLDFYRFSSDSVIDYDKLQCDLIRQHSDKPITHNAMIYFSDLDYHKLAQNLDILTWDNYPLGMLETGFLSEDLKKRYLRTGHPDLISLMHDLYYGAKGKPFWVMGAAARTGQLGPLKPPTCSRARCGSGPIRRSRTAQTWSRIFAGERRRVHRS